MGEIHLILELVEIDNVFLEDSNDLFEWVHDFHGAARTLEVLLLRFVSILHNHTFLMELATAILAHELPGRVLDDVNAAIADALRIVYRQVTDLFYGRDVLHLYCMRVRNTGL